ncbi:hypothetical protein KIL84_022287 [Mauremys mutica]|uniref:Uncharacterized protein n=1 Tax=Mauremys mutica TaxID=74926 RepID=A0A9D3X974_9SAUR|nr:hypothetical protein KIL84_022287 [Mauremys mutica]
MTMCLKYSLQDRPDLENCWCRVGKRENSGSLMRPTFLVDCSSGRKELLNAWPDSNIYRCPLRRFPSRTRMETYVIFCCDVSVYGRQIVQSKGSEEDMSCAPAQVSASSQPGTGASVEAPESFSSKAPVSMRQQCHVRSCAKSNAAAGGSDSRSLQRSPWCMVKHFLKGLALCVFRQTD